MSTPGYLDVTKAPDHHNASAQHPVVENSDSALDVSHGHPHRHLHHGEHAEQGELGEPLYSEGNTFEKSTIPNQDDHQYHDPARRRHVGLSKASAGLEDKEKGDLSLNGLEEDDPRTHTLSNFYRKYRIFFHLFVWLFFTGYVICMGNFRSWGKN